MPSIFTRYKAKFYNTKTALDCDFILLFQKLFISLRSNENELFSGKINYENPTYYIFNES